MIRTIFAIQLLLLPFLMPGIIGQPPVSANQFLSLVVEATINPENGETTAKLLSSRKVDGRLKSPTKSEKIGEGQYLTIQVLDAAEKIIQTLAFKNPFQTDYEYVNEEGNLEHVRIPENTKAYHIRIPYKTEMEWVQIVLNEDTSHQLLLKAKLDD